MKNKIYIGFIMLLLLLAIAVFLPQIYFKISDAKDISKVIVEKKISIEDSEKTNNDVIENLKIGSELIKNSNSTNLQALQKKEMTDSEFNRLYGELNNLVKCGLIKQINGEKIKEHLIYVAYYNILNSTDQVSLPLSVSLKEFKFTDYSSFEYSIWMDGRTDKIYEVTLIDEEMDFTLTNLDYMNGISEYFEIDNISPIDDLNENHIKYYQISIGDFQGKSYYSEFSIYNPSTADFVLSESGVNWSVFSKELSK